MRAGARTLTRDEITGDEIQRLIRDMRETMQDAPGVGLAAPQVGLPLQLAVIEDREEYLKAVSAGELAEKERVAVPFHVIINPATGDHRRRYGRVLRRLPESRRLFCARAEGASSSRQLSE